MAHYHLIGILGTGMSALAKFLCDQGHRVSGTDHGFNGNLPNFFVESHIEVFQKEYPNMAHVNYVVYSTAIKSQHNDLVAAVNRNIPCIHRSELIAEIGSKFKNNIAVTGTHGKSTTTAFIAWIMQSLKMDSSYLIGASPSGFSNAKFQGKQTFVYEADESDGSVLNCEPTHVLLTNLEADHLEFHEDNFNVLIDKMTGFAKRSKFLNVFIDDPQISKMIKDFDNTVITYGTHRSADYHITSTTQKKDSITIKLKIKKPTVESYSLTIKTLGLFNAFNVVGAISLIHQYFPDIEKIIKAAESFPGIDRRMKALGTTTIGKFNAQIIDDYAHHPTEVKNVLESLNQLKKEIIVVFQPHRLYRLKSFLSEFALSLSLAQTVILLDVFDPTNVVDHDNNIKKLQDKLKTNKCKTCLLLDHSKMKATLTRYVKSDVIVVFLGAGNITKIANDLVKTCQNTPITA